MAPIWLPMAISWLYISLIVVLPILFGLMLLKINGKFNDVSNRFDEINKRIGELSNQMQRENDTLSKKVDVLLERSK